MKKYYLFFLVSLLMKVTLIQAQQTPTKDFPKYTKAGDVFALYTYGEYVNPSSARTYVIDVAKAAKYYISILADMQAGEYFKVYLDDVPFVGLTAQTDGWQRISNAVAGIEIAIGKHKLTFLGKGPMVPMVEEFALTTVPPTGRSSNDAINTFLDQVEQLKQQPVIIQPSASEVGDLTERVLPNPLGNYDHAVDTNFTYSHFSLIYLNAGYHTFTTSGSTISRSLTIFNPADYTYSWSNVNGGVGGESSLPLYVAVSGYYAIMLRPYPSGVGTTNIIYNGSVLVSGAVIGGRTYAMSKLKGGPLNFFTCRLTGGDTRMIASRYFASSARGYNDDYGGGGGDWAWGTASRIKKDFSGIDSVQYAFVCAYSPTSTGNSDVYMGNLNSDVNNTNFPEFPLLKPDDAIMGGSNVDGYYNCIGWSGGMTSWVWPPGVYSTYNCTSTPGDVTCFDHFYMNQPVRYPGAWNYTRTGATVTNAIVDLWKLNSTYTHASVRKPGNNHPHGYDWESKPGGTNRTLHPRNALTNTSFGYGAVTNYYIPTGTYARNGELVQSFESDVDAVKAGVAVFENAKLTGTATDKLKTFLRKVDYQFNSDFNELYAAWKKTWAANAIYSDPAMYCRNEEYKAMAAYAQKNPRSAMLLVFDKFVNEGAHLLGDLMWTLTNEKYGYLLTEVKRERTENPNDAQGRYKIHGDHDNGVLYVEKILQLLQAEPGAATITDDINVVVSPNPVKDRMVVQVTTTKNAKVTVNAISAQTRQTKILQAETMLAAGVHRFNMDIIGFAGNSGDIVAVQVVVDGVMKTVKVLVTR